MCLEPVTAGGGVITPPEGYWDRVQEICRKYDILLHIDEVVCGVGRTGTWFGYQNYGVQPDFVTMAKGVASGYAAISCMVTTEAVFEQFKDAPDDKLSYFRDISTFGGCTSGPAAALENMRIIEDEDLLNNTLKMGERMMNNLHGLMDKHRVIGDVRGKGLFCGAELVADRDHQGTGRGKEGAGRRRRLHGAGRDHRHDQPLASRFQQHAVLLAGADRHADDIDQITDAVDKALTRVFSLEVLRRGLRPRRDALRARIFSDK